MSLFCCYIVNYCKWKWASSLPLDLGQLDESMIKISADEHGTNDIALVVALLGPTPIPAAATPSPSATPSLLGHQTCGR